MDTHHRPALWSALALSLALAGCNSGGTEAERAPASAPVANAASEQPAPLAPNASPIRFTDITRQAGIRFVHNNGAFGAALLPETMGGGGVFFDYDSDGYADIFLVNGRNWTQREVLTYEKSPVTQKEMQLLIATARREGTPNVRRSPPNKPYQRTVGALYHNNRDGTFSDVTKNSGLDIEMLGMGAAAGDYDGDGQADLCVTSYGRLYLFRNLGRGRFREEAARAGATDSEWGTSAAWFDYDRDGRLDLFLCRYLKWTPTNDTFVSLDGRVKSYGWPKTYPSQTCRLFRNKGGGKFEDASAKAGITRRLGKATSGKGAGDKSGLIEGAALGVVVCDPNEDGWPDLIVANDLRSNFLFQNQKNGTFQEIAAKSGIALSKGGQARGGMGIDSADIDHSGRDSVAIGHFNADIMGLWYDSGGGAFSDIADATVVGPASATFLTFGLLFADFDNDTWPDLLAANGHVDPTVHNYLLAVTYEERPLLFLNETAISKSIPRSPQFREIGLAAGLSMEIVARGVAVADIDLDGDQDVLMTTNGGPPLLMRNDGGAQKRALRLILRGQAPNSQAIGARIQAVIETRSGALTVRREVRTGSSYLSQNELPITLGLDGAAQVKSLAVRWPNGQTSRFKDLAADQTVTISQSAGIVEQRPLARRVRP